MWDDENKLIKDELLSISYRGINNTLDVKGSELYDNENGKFYYNITDYGKDFGLTDEGVKSSFIIIK